MSTSNVGRRRRSLASRPFKLLLIGTAKVGKTSLLRRLVNDEFDERTVTTVGYNVQNFDVAIPPLGNNAEEHTAVDVRLQIWDTEGHKRFKTITNSYYHNARAIVLCFDISSASTFQDLEDWVKDVRKSAPQGVLLFLVATKVDLPTRDWRVDMDIAESWAERNEMLFYALSAKTGGNVKESFTAIADNLIRVFSLSPSITLPIANTGQKECIPHRTLSGGRVTQHSLVPDHRDNAFTKQSSESSTSQNSTDDLATDERISDEAITTQTSPKPQRSFIASVLGAVSSALGLRILTAGNTNLGYSQDSSEPRDIATVSQYTDNRNSTSLDVRRNRSAPSSRSATPLTALGVGTTRRSVSSNNAFSLNDGGSEPPTVTDWFRTGSSNSIANVIPSTSSGLSQFVSLDQVSIKGWPSQGLASLLAQSAQQHREVVRRNSGGSIGHSSTPNLYPDHIRNQHPLPQLDLDGGMSSSNYAAVSSQKQQHHRSWNSRSNTEGDILVDCANGCGIQYNAEHYGSHVASCPKRTVLCRLGCGESVLVLNTQAHEKAHRLIPVTKWGCREVIHWFVQLIGLENWNLDAVRASDIDGKCLLQLSQEDLIDPLRITSGIKRVRVLKAIEALNLDILASRSIAAAHHEYQTFTSKFSTTSFISKNDTDHSKSTPRKGQSSQVSSEYESMITGQSSFDSNLNFSNARQRTVSDESERFSLWDKMLATGAMDDVSEDESGISSTEQLDTKVNQQQVRHVMLQDDLDSNSNGSIGEQDDDLMEKIQYPPRGRSKLSMLDNANQTEQAVELQDGRFVWVRCIKFPELELQPSVVGSGSFGTVFIGHYHGATVAVKRLHAQKFDPAQLLREAAVMQSVSAHPHILHFFGVILTPPDAGFVSEALSCSLEEWLRRDKGNNEEPLNEILRFAAEAASGLLHLHCEKVVHRDVAARNLLLDSSRPRRVKICDFGMARVAETIGFGADAADGGGGSLNLVGPIRWMAPESLRPVKGHTKFSFKSDVYMFGITLWELLSRDLPYAGVPVDQVGTQVLQENLRPPRAPLKPEVKQSISLFLETHSQRYGTDRVNRKTKTVAVLLVQLMEQCWASNPKTRPSMQQVYESLSKTLEHS